MNSSTILNRLSALFAIALLIITACTYTSAKPTERPLQLTPAHEDQYRSSSTSTSSTSLTFDFNYRLPIAKSLANYSIAKHDSYLPAKRFQMPAPTIHVFVDGSAGFGSVRRKAQIKRKGQTQH